MSAADLGFYDGSRIFLWLVPKTGLSLDQVNFAVSQVAALALAVWLRKGFHPRRVSPSTRHLFSSISGFSMLYFCFGSQIIHAILLPLLCYIAMNILSPKVYQRVILFIALGYLSSVHLMRQIYSYGSYTLDITGPIMLITEKVTSLAFNLHDGLGREESSLTNEQRQYAIKKLPSVLEYTSYMYHFQSVMCGPLIFYKDYINFIEGISLQNSPKANGVHSNGHIANVDVTFEPSPLRPVIIKVILGIINVYLLLKIAPLFPLNLLKDGDFLQNTSFFVKFYTIYIITVVARFKYYHAWFIADAVCNASGLGFNGYDEKGNAKWDLMTNVDVIQVEFGTSLRDVFQNWNKGTMVWLRRIAYDRSPFFKTAATFGLSALWHGFYPGYYFAFTTATILTLAARNVRRSIRPFFQVSPAWARTYDVITSLTARAALAYMTFPFVLLELEPSFNTLLSIGFYFHVLSLLAIFVLPSILPLKQKSKDKQL